MVTRLLVAAFVSATLLGRSGLPFGIEAPDLIFPLLAGAVAVKGLHTRRGDVGVALFLAGVTAAALANPSRSGALEVVKLLYSAAILLIVREVARRGLRLPIVGAMVVASCAICVLTLVNVAADYIGWSDSTLLVWRHPLRSGFILWRARGAFGVPEMLSEALTVSIPLALAWRSAAQARVRRWLGAGIATMMCVGTLTFSHGIVGAGGSLLWYAWPSLSRWSRRWAVVGWTGTFLAVFLLSSALPRPAGTMPLSPFAAQVVAAQDVAFGGRSWTIEWFHYGALKGLALLAFLGSPWVGIGPGGFNQAAQLAGLEQVLPPIMLAADPHCELTGKLAETGLVGTLPMLVLWAIWIGRARRATDVYARAAGAGILGILVNGVHVDFMTFRFLWLALAILESAPDSSDGPDTEAAQAGPGHLEAAPVSR